MNDKYQKVSMFDMCDKLGEKQLYRGLYSRLSSTVHANADSLIDYIIFKSYTYDDEAKAKNAAKEVYEWMVYYFLSISEAYFSAFNLFLRCFSLDKINDRFQKIKDRFDLTNKKYLERLEIVGKNTMHSRC